MKRSLLAGVGIVAAAGLALAGCSGTGTTSNPSSTPNTSIVIAVGALADSLTAQPWGGSASHVILSGLGSQLLQYKTAGDDNADCNSPTYTISGRLASSATPAPDGKGIIVKLNKLTSQWGNTLSAQDVVWSMQTGMVRQPVMKSTLSGSGFDVNNIATVIDATTVELNTTAIYSYTIESLQNNLFYIYDSTEAKKHVTADDPTANNWLSKNLADYSGWKLQSFVPGTSLSLTADPAWGGTRGNITRIVVNAVSNTATRSQLAQSGELQISNGFDYSQYASLSKQTGIQVLNCTSRSRDTLMFNTKAGALSSPEVRRAISMAIDRDALVKGPYSGFGTAAKAIFPGVTATGSYTYDPTTAKKMLAEAGYPNGFDLTLTYSPTRPGPVADKSAVLIQSQLAAVGIKVQLQNVASTTDFSTALINGRFQAVLYSEPIVIADPGFYAFAYLGTGAASNTTGWSDPRFDKARLQLANSTDASTRQGLLQQMANYVDDGDPILSLVEIKNMMVTHQGITGAIPLSNDQVYFNALGAK